MLRKTALRRARGAGIGVSIGAAMALLVAAPGAPVASTAAAPDITPVADIAGSTPLPSVATPMWQTNGTVWSIAYSGNRIYIGGTFSKVRPPGVAPGGTGEVTANNLAAFDATTGAYIPAFKHSTSANVYSLAVAPDGGTLYVGGDFGKLDNQPRTRIGAINLTTAAGTLSPWAPQVSGLRVHAVTVNSAGNTVYFGGNYSSVDGQSRANLAAYAPASAAAPALLPWAPTVDGPVAAMMVTPQQDKVVVGGGFDEVNGEFHRALGLVDATDGTNETLPDSQTLLPGDCRNGCENYSTVRSLTTDGKNVFVGAEGQGYGWFDGTLALDPVAGTLLWRNNCLGATQAVQVVGTQLYVGSHTHDCAGVPGGFPQAPLQQGWHHLVSEDIDTGTVQPWFPNTNAGPGDNVIYDVGPRSMGTDGKTLFVGGSFTTVNGQPQQGIARFVPGGKGAAPTAPPKPIVSSNDPGSITIKMFTGSDLDDGLLTYRLYRDGVVKKTFPNVYSRWWLATLIKTKDFVTSGTHSYQVDAVDAKGNVSPKSAVATATVATKSNGGLPQAVKNSKPDIYWKLGEAAGATTAADASGHGVTGTVQRGVTFKSPALTPGSYGADVSDPQITQDGPSAPMPTAYSIELWFKTTSKTGGRLAGFGDSQTGDSNHNDPMLYMDAGGQLIFGMWDPTATTPYTGDWGAGGYNDGAWHHVVVSNSGTRLFMYVDGVLQPMQNLAPKTPANWNAWFRVGTDTFGFWPLPPVTAGFTGQIDDVAMYRRALPGSEVLAHYKAAG